MAKTGVGSILIPKISKIKRRTRGGPTRCSIKIASSDKPGLAAGPNKPPAALNRTLQWRPFGQQAGPSASRPAGRRLHLRLDATKRQISMQLLRRLQSSIPQATNQLAPTTTTCPRKQRKCILEDALQL